MSYRIVLGSLGVHMDVSPSGSLAQQHCFQGLEPLYRVVSESAVRSNLVGLPPETPDYGCKGLELDHGPL